MLFDHTDLLLMELFSIACRYIFLCFNLHLSLLFSLAVESFIDRPVGSTWRPEYHASVFVRLKWLDIELVLLHSPCINSVVWY